MKILIQSIILLLLTITVSSQQLSQVTFSGGSYLNSFSFRTDQDVLIRVTPDGNLIDWGMEVANRYNYYAPSLQPFMGRIEYYGPESDSSFRGKVRSIGTCNLTYYGSYEADSKPGKIRTIGNLLFDYYTKFDNIAIRGKIRFVGYQEFTYFFSNIDESFNGKLKSIAGTTINYYSIFDDRYNHGKLKSIGSVVFQWYSEFDPARGSLKTGFNRSNIGGVTYILF